MVAILVLLFLLGLTVAIAYGIYRFVDDFAGLVSKEPDSVSLVIIFVALLTVSFPLALVMYWHYDGRAKK